MKDRSIKADQVVEAEACAWIAQLESGNLSPQDRAELESWVARSPQHAAALLHYARHWQMADSLSVLHEPMETALKEKRSAHRGIAGRRMGGLTYALCSLAVVLFAGIVFFLVPRSAGPALDETSIATAIGESRQASLSDGSTVIANTDTAVRFSFDDHYRHAYLIRGEAIFTVAKDPSRPFIVHAGNQTVRAVGTEFAVRLGVDDIVTVSVTEGLVELAVSPVTATAETTQPFAPAAPSAVLAKGYSATARPSGLEVVQTAEVGRMEQRLSWRNGVLDFSGETLDYAVHEIMRYSPYEVSIEDPQLREMQIGGVFQMSDADELFDILEESFGVKVRYEDNNVVRLSLADPQAGSQAGNE